jgi:hypothetical protein
MAMTTGDWWQLAGGALEFVGLMTVVLGISETRRAFTDRPSLLGRAARPFRWVVRRFFAKPRVIEAAGTARVTVRGFGHGRVIRSWTGLPLEERVERLQKAVDQHDGQLDELADRLEEERRQREAGDQAERAAREEIRQSLEERIAQAAAGGLSLEALGATFFGLGILCTVVGVIVG